MIQKSFAWIKRHLDPARSYIIFENDLIKQPVSIFSESHAVYQYLKKENHDYKKVCDAETNKEYLVIQIDPGNEDEILGKIMGYGFLKGTTSYLYKAEMQE